MNNDTTYNGWTNRATWCVALWLDSDGDANRWREVYGSKKDKAKAIADLAAQLQWEAEERACEAAMGGMLNDLMMATLCTVNWREIARNVLGVYEEAVA